jgi:hypothetical protein
MQVLFKFQIILFILCYLRSHNVSQYIMIYFGILLFIESTLKNCIFNVMILPDVLTSNINKYNHNMSYLSYESGAIDWCEPNYVYSEYIVEFWNTISNILFLIFGYYGLIYCKNNKLKLSFKLLFTTYICIGIASAYFHCTLSFFGQILDELCIYLLIMMIINKYIIINIVYCILVIPIMFVFPQYNPYFLYATGSALLYIVYGLYNKLNYVQKAMCKFMTLLFVLSIFFWVFDKICLYENFIHTHFLFHITISCMGFIGIMLLDFIDNDRHNYNSILDLASNI